MSTSLKSISKTISLSRQPTPKKMISNASISSLDSDIQDEKKFLKKLESKINNITTSSSKGFARSITPVSSKLLEHRINLDLNQIYKGSVSVITNKPCIKSTTDRKPSAPLRATPTLFRIATPVDDDLSFNQRNIENLRNELNRKREIIVGLKDTLSRKDLENKY